MLLLFLFFRFGVINMKCTYSSLDQMKRLKKENILKVTEFTCSDTNIDKANLNTNGLKEYLSKNVFIYWMFQKLHIFIRSIHYNDK